jgi:glycosidase
MLNDHRQLIRLRHQHPALRTGDYRVLLAQGNVYVFARSLATDVVVVAINVGTETAQVSIAADDAIHTKTVVFGTGAIAYTDQSLYITLPARTGLIGI